MAGCNALTPEQVHDVAATFSGLWGTRNRSMFIVQTMTGFRISELLSIHRVDLFNAAGELLPELHVKAKNMKGSKRSRSVHINETCKRALEKWLEASPSYIHKADALFCKSNGIAISRQAAWKIYKAAFIQAGILDHGYATHTCRKTFAVTMNEIFQATAMQAFIDKKPYENALTSLMKAMGHRSIEATRRYLPEPKETGKAVHAMGDQFKTL